MDENKPDVLPYDFEAGGAAILRRLDECGQSAIAVAFIRHDTQRLAQIMALCARLDSRAADLLPQSQEVAS